MTDMTHAVARSPLAQMAPVTGAVSLTELPLCGKVTLRGELADTAFVAACEQVLGVAPQATLAPPQSCTAGTLYWIGPNEWQLFCDLDKTAQIVADLEGTRSEAHLSAVDVTDYYVVLRLEGELARSVLSRGTPMDMHTQAFLAGDARATRFSKCSVLLHSHSDTCFDVQVRWSHAEYLWQFIAQAASQYN